MKYNLISPRSYSSPIAQVLVNRGIQEKDILHYLNTTPDDILDPLLIGNIDIGAKMLATHIKNNDKIFIQVDADCDGFTSAAVLINWLYKLFPYYTSHNIIYRLHEDKSHGIILDTIPDDVKLVIIPDAGSNQFEEHKILFDKGIDVLVIDHHLADKVSEYACVINNQIDDYPNKSLSGVGMVYKFCSYLDNILGIDNAKYYLDLVALGIIADEVSCQSFETREIIKEGLSNIHNPFFESMYERNAYSIGGELTYEGVAFYIAPYINATIRVGTIEEKQLLFESMLEYQSYEDIPSTKRGCTGMEPKVEQACRNCANIKNRQTKARDASLEQIEEKIEKLNLNANKILVIQLDEPVDKNLTGLIANQIAGKYQKPTLLLNKEETEDGIIWRGSGRGYDRSEFKGFSNFINASGYGIAQGHLNAFGATFEDDKVEPFIQYANYKLEHFDFSPCYLVDFIFKYDDLSIQDIYDISHSKKYWGKEVEEPLIAIEDITLTKDNITLMSADRNPTLKIMLSDNINAIKFRSGYNEYNNLCSSLGCVKINIVGRCSLNTYNGNTTAQILITDYEITTRTEFYF